MEVDHRLLPRRIAKALRGTAKGDAEHLAKSSDRAIAGVDQRRNRESRSEGFGACARGVFADGVRTVGTAAGRGCAAVGTGASGARSALNFFSGVSIWRRAGQDRYRA